MNSAILNAPLAQMDKHIEALIKLGFSMYQASTTLEVNGEQFIIKDETFYE